MLLRVLISSVLISSLIGLDQPRLAADGPGKRVREIIAAAGADVAVAFRTLDGRDELLIDADTPFHAASTMKVPVMIELFRQAQARQLSLEEPLAIRNQFHSLSTGPRTRSATGTIPTARSTRRSARQ